MWKKIKFSILIKYYCFFFCGWGNLCTRPRDNGGLSEGTTFEYFSYFSLPSTHKLSLCVVSVKNNSVSMSFGATEQIIGEKTGVASRALLSESDH